MHAKMEHKAQNSQAESLSNAFLQSIKEPAIAAASAARQAQALVDAPEAQQAAEHITSSLQKLLPNASFSLEPEANPASQGRPGRARACAGALIVALRTAAERCETEEARLLACRQQGSDNALAVARTHAVLVSLYENEVSVLVDELQACALKSDKTYKTW